MPRRGHQGRVDGNHVAIVAALQRHGFSVISLARLGGGVPDLLVGGNGRCLLLEVKQPGEKLNELQRSWHANWRGAVETTDSPEDAVAVAREALA